MPEKDVLRRYPWTEQELRDEGFRYDQRRKEVVLARELPEDKLYDYSHWPVRGDHFADLYQPWDEKGWNPTPSEQHLISFGCQPFFHHVGVWAKKRPGPPWCKA